MRAVLRIEAIGDNYIWMAKHKRGSTARKLHYKEEIAIIRYGRRELWPWVAGIALIEGKLERDFIEGYKDYTNANHDGSRGIFILYPLKPGVYEVNKSVRLGVPKRYFIRVLDGTITEITREEVLQCLTTTSDTSE
jgi:hypothetical protein